VLLEIIPQTCQPLHKMAIILFLCRLLLELTIHRLSLLLQCFSQHLKSRENSVELQGEFK